VTVINLNRLFNTTDPFHQRRCMRRQPLTRQPRFRFTWGRLQVQVQEHARVRVRVRVQTQEWQRVRP